MKLPTLGKMRAFCLGSTKYSVVYGFTPVVFLFLSKTFRVSKANRRAQSQFAREIQLLTNVREETESTSFQRLFPWKCKPCRRGFLEQPAQIKRKRI